MQRVAAYNLEDARKGTTRRHTMNTFQLSAQALAMLGPIAMIVVGVLVILALAYTVRNR